jgi:hypothetical protein
MPGAPVPGAKKSNGCLVAVGVLAGVTLLSCLVGGLVLWRVSKNPEVMKVLNTIGEGAKLAIEGSKAPGAEELRKAGCPQAIIVDGRRMTELVSKFLDAGEDALPPDASADVVVICQGTSAKDTLPSCDQAALVYAQAALPAGPFRVIVSRQGTGNEQGNDCEGLYDAMGAALPDAPPDEELHEGEDPGFDADEEPAPDAPAPEAPEGAK